MRKIPKDTVTAVKVDCNNRSHFRLKELTGAAEILEVVEATRGGEITFDVWAKINGKVGLIDGMILCLAVLPCGSPLHSKFTVDEVFELPEYITFKESFVEECEGGERTLFKITLGKE